jgi:WD40 repeat protein
MAERDPILWSMINELAELDEGALERPSPQVSRPPRNNKHITQVITRRDPPLNGQTPKPDHSQEENDMNSLTMNTFLPARPRTEYPFAVRFITLAAAVLILALLGGILIQMVNQNPLIGYLGSVSLATEEPKPCTADTVTDPSTESVRLANAATTILDAKGDTSLAALLSLCALNTGYSMDADAALQKALNSAGLMPVLMGHTGSVFGAQFSPDGKYILTSSWDGTARLWDALTLQEVRQIKQSALVLTAGFSPDGKYILTTGNGDDPNVRLYETETGTLIYTFKGHTWTVFNQAFSPDGQYAVSTGFDGSARLWNLTTGEPGRVFHISDKNLTVAGVAFTPDGEHLIIGSADPSSDAGLSQEWDIATGQSVRQFADSNIVDHGLDIKFSPDGRYMLMAGENGVVLWDYQSGQEIRALTTTFALSVAFSPDGKLALISDGGESPGLPTAHLYNVETGEALRIFTLNAGSGGGFSSDGRRIVTALNSQIQYSTSPLPVYVYDTDIHDFIAFACSKMTRDFTTEERTQYGLGEGKVCP